MRIVLTVCLLALLFTGKLSAQEFSLERHDDHVAIRQGDQLVANYVLKSKSKPIIYPLIGPDGTPMTRDYPMVADSKNEAHDHPHHRSLWFTHGEVNDVDFWAEGDTRGSIEHDEFTQLSDGQQAVIASRNTWRKADGSIVLTDQRRFTFGGDEKLRWLDCEFQLNASHGDVHFGDTKEGTFGIRVAESMKMDAKQGGTIINSRGDAGNDAWGKPAEWVDYYGPVQGKTLGIAILCHPSSYNFPNRWHVRSYGLFAANPFGVFHFTGDKTPTDGTRLKQGDALVLRYRVVLHRGTTDDAGIGKLYAAFAETDFATLP
jgi:hypothetical protein